MNGRCPRFGANCEVQIPSKIRIWRICCENCLLHSVIRAEWLHLRDKEREALVNCAKSKPIDSSDPDLYMEAHRKGVGETALRNSPFVRQPDQVSISRDACARNSLVDLSGSHFPSRFVWSAERFLPDARSGVAERR